MKMWTGTVVILTAFLLKMINDGLARTTSEDAGKLFLVKLDNHRNRKIGKHIDIPSATMELYKLMSINNSTTANATVRGLPKKPANTARTYINKGSPSTNPRSQRYRLQFDVKPLPEIERIVVAEVRFVMSYNAPLQHDESIKVIVHDIVKPGQKGITKPILRQLDSKIVNRSNAFKSEAINFDVTPAIERLSQENFFDNYGILVQCIMESGGHTHLLDVFDFETFEKAVLIIYTDDGTMGKTADTMGQRSIGKRSADNETAKILHKTAKLCQRYPLYVDFKEIGFNDWIQAPPGFDAFYCHGVCMFPLADHMNASNHAVIQTLMHNVHPDTVPKPCCVPTKLGTQTLLYLDDDDKLVVKTYYDMIVEECGCR